MYALCFIVDSVLKKILTNSILKYDVNFIKWKIKQYIIGIKEMLILIIFML